MLQVPRAGAVIDFVASAGMLQLPPPQSSGASTPFLGTTPPTGEREAGVVVAMAAKPVAMAASSEAMAANQPAMAAEARAKVCPDLTLPQIQPLNLPLRLREHLTWWSQRAPAHILQILEHGVHSDWPSPALRICPCHRDKESENDALLLLQDYCGVGAAHLLSEGNFCFLPRNS